MRILLAHNSTYYPSHGGGDKSNRLLMSALAARGHQVRVVSRVEKFGAEDHGRLVRGLENRGLTCTTDDEGAVRFRLQEVDVRTLALRPHLRAFFANQITEFDPDVIVTSTDDPGQLMFDLALRAPRSRVAYLVRATIAVPFGPDSSMLSATKTDVLRNADAVVGVSHYVADYVRKWSGIDAIHVPISLLENTNFPELASFDNLYVAMVNPCLVKGITIFLELADRMPEVSFGAVPTWGTTEKDIAALRARPNIAVIPPFDNMDDLLKLTKVMLVPSVWAEARSRVVLEAMACGIPVIASDVGGLKEAHLGVPYLLPVNPVERYKPAVDLNMVPVAEVPPQDVAPWMAAIGRLVEDRAHYEDLSRASRRAALAYAENLHVLPFEAVLQEMLGKPKKGVQAAVPPATRPEMSEDKKRLLALRLKQRQAPDRPTNVWFAGLEDTEAGKLTLFCFPYAGGGVMPYRAWRESLHDIAVCALRLPGRESRRNEPHLETMDSLIPVLGAEFVQVARPPFAFYGHSMGAGIAFELTRWLRRNNHALPNALCVSSARAPQLRVQPDTGPELDEQSLLEQIRRLEGMPDDVLKSPELLSLVLPVLQADVKMYRRYVYTPAPPLNVPIRVYGGASDPQVGPEHLDAWREQTVSSFRRHELPGGHFFLNTSREPFLSHLSGDLRQVLPDP